MKISRLTKNGYTLIELIIVMGLFAILMSVVIPSFVGFTNEAMVTKAQGDMRLVQIAVESYYKNHGCYPSTKTCMSTLLSAAPRILECPVYDPFHPTKNTPYGYDLSSKATSDAKYYVIYSIACGPGGCNGYQKGGYAEVDQNGIVTLYNDVLLWVSNGHLP